MDMTLDQIKLYAKACTKHDKRMAWFMTNNVLVGTRADQQGMDKYQRQLGV